MEESNIRVLGQLKKGYRYEVKPYVADDELEEVLGELNDRMAQAFLMRNSAKRDGVETSTIIAVVRDADNDNQEASVQK